MSKNIGRRKFIKGTAGATMGALVLPGSSVFLGSCDADKNSKNNIHGGPDLLANIDWGLLLSDHDLIWKRVPTEMKEAPHFGNGLLGSMFWVEDNMIRLQVFRTDVHDHADHTYGWSAYSRPRYQIGYFLLKPKGNIVGCDLRQDIYYAELRGSINTSLGSISLHHLVHRLDDIIYTKIECAGSEELSEWQWHPFEAKTSRGGDPSKYGPYAPYKKLINPDNEVESKGKIKVSIQDLTSGGDYATAWLEKRHSSTRGTLLVNIENSYPDKSSASTSVSNIEKVENKIEKGLKKWIKEHRGWWHSYYPESFVTFPDSVGQTFYWTNVYRLACCTRPDAQYIDTPGMWNSGGPWPYSTHDYNTQTVHFPVYTANRLHLGEALVESIHRNRNNLIANVVPEEWQEDSALLPLATAFDLRGKRDGDLRYSEMVGCLPWLLNNCWLQYKYTMDKEMLRVKIFPILKRSINLYRHLLFKGDDGKLYLPPTYSPEIGNTSDCNMDLALLKWGCQKLIEICGILNIDDPLIPEWKHIIDNLVDYPTDEYGYRMGKDESAPLGHRHMSHLMMIYPLYLENLDNAADIDLLEKSVRNYEPDWAVKMGASQSSPAASALGLGNLAHQRMNYILSRDTENETLGKNGMYYLATPCIETSLSYNTCVQDMLLQSWGEKIRVFPALPDEWQDVAFYNFRTEGAFLVSASRKNGKTEFVKIKSLAGEPCTVKTSIEGDLAVRSSEEIKVEKVSEDCYSLDIKKGDEVILYPLGTHPDFKIEAMPVDQDKKNYFGLK
ncbi:MAG: alpha-L-fucosidase [Bacteroidales bacterium]|nr:alpha-L-fucosidase [Bacteroidales bacterium]